MPRTPRMIIEDEPAIYHVMSRTALDDSKKRGQVLSAILSAFTYDETGNYSETAHVSATPTPDPNPPPTPPTGLEIVNGP